MLIFIKKKQEANCQLTIRVFVLYEVDFNNKLVDDIESIAVPQPAKIRTAIHRPT